VINITINIGNNQLSQVNSTKFLGIIIDEHLTWNDHINYVANIKYRRQKVVQAAIINNLLALQDLLYNI
jgi:hypothetical protein